MIEFITGASGTGKSTIMMQRIKELAEKDKKICILVPEQFSHEFDKKLYHFVGAEKFNNLTSQSFTGLARELFQQYGDVGRNGVYADETARMILIYQAIEAYQHNNVSKKCFNKQAVRTGFAEEMLKLIEELKKSGVTPELLMEKSEVEEKRLSSKINDTAVIYLEYERLLKEYGFKDNMDDLKSASEIANLNGYFKDVNVFVDEFESFTGDQIEFLKTIFSTSKNVTVSLRTDNVYAEKFTLFETVNNTFHTLSAICRESNINLNITKCEKSYRFKSEDIAYLSENILRNKSFAKSSSVPSPENLKIFEARDMYSEAEYVCATIKRLMYEDKSLRYSDIAVISNTIEDYAQLLSASFKRYDIPYFLSIEKQVNHTTIMIFVSTLLDIVTSRKYSSELIFRLLKCSLLEISLTDAASLENYCYKWGIDGDTWKTSFTAPDENLEKYEQIRKQLIDSTEELKRRLKGKKTAATLCRHLYLYLCNCGAEKQISITINTLVKENKDNEASELKRLWECLIDMLDSITDTLRGTQISISELKRIIKSLINRITYSLAPQTLDSVTSASARTARLNSPRVVFILGANEGDFPNSVNTHGIFSENDKQKLSDNGIEISRRLPELIASERLVVYKSFSTASEKLYISYPLSDLSGQQKYSAPVTDDIIKMFGADNLLLNEGMITPDYYAVTMQSAFYHYMHNIKGNTSTIKAIGKVLESNPEYRRRLEYVLKRSEARDAYRIDSALMERLKGFEPLMISPTSLELYNRCHFKYFCSECLRLFKREKIDLTAQHSGSIIHQCFYNMLSQRSKEEFLKLSYNQLKSEISKSAEQYLNENMGGDFAKNPRFELGFKKLAQRLTRVFVHTQQELMESDFTPKAFEINLRDESINNALVLPVGKGRKLSFGGIIDRADTCTIDGKEYLRIVDYKSSMKKIDALTISAGINMQMLLYLFTITGDNGIFSGHIPAGVLYSPVSISSIEAENSRNDTENHSLIESSLKSGGLLIDDKEILNAMETDIKGRFIPAELDKNNDISLKSSCISKKGFEELKTLAFRKLTEMAESLHSGDVEANPLVLSAAENPCSYCEYSDICGNNFEEHHRSSEDIDISEAEIILSMREGEVEDNGLDETAE